MKKHLAIAVIFFVDAIITCVAAIVNLSGALFLCSILALIACVKEVSLFIDTRK